MPFGEIKSEDMPVVFGFARATAEKIGLCQRSIKLAVMIWSRLAPAVRLRLAGTALADKQTELKALSDLTGALQVLDLILGEDHRDINNVAEAVDCLKGNPIPTDYARAYSSLNKNIKSLPETVLDSLIASNEVIIIASLRRLGRI